MKRIQLAGELDQARQKITLLREEIRIKDARLAKIPPHQRPFYPPTERLAILALRTARCWNLLQTASAFLVEPATISNWMKRLDEDGEQALVKLPVPVNRFPDFVALVVQQLKCLCPVMGKKRIAQILVRLGLQLSASSAGRFLKKPSQPQPPSTINHNFNPSVRTVSAYYPNHVWHVDLTVVPTQAGFW
ncbi:MAG: helix-turn-helix domain containing protein, partial [Lentisphaerae bacterium]|nr:helix-turn-helix domain containing protein [Lentisphaerota bacterium]